MNKNIFFKASLLICTLLVTGCDQNINDSLSNSSDSISNSSDSIVILNWNEETLESLSSVISPTSLVPYFTDFKSYQTTSGLDGESKYYIVNIFGEVNKIDTAIKDYKSQIDKIQDWKYIESSSSEGLAYYQLQTPGVAATYFDFYFVNNIFTIEIGKLYVPPVDPTVDDIKGDITLLPTNFYISTGSEYGQDNLVCEGGGMHYTTTSIKKGFENVEAIQMKKLVSHFENCNELPALTSIKINQIDSGSYTGTFTVYGGTSASNLSIISEGEGGVYSMNNSTYFKIENVSSYACYASSIVFDFASL
jgi:hypothetical protein